MPHHPLVVLTGASRGLGLAIARILLVDFNANVLAVSRSRSSELDELAKAYPQALTIAQCSVTDQSAVTQALLQAEQKYDAPLDGIIFNAGTLDPLRRIDSPENTVEAWKSHFDVNLFSVFATLQAALPSLRKSEHGGRVVFVSSGSAVGATPAWAAYNASKAALNSLCRTFAQEEPDIVSVALRPGKVDTDMQGILRSQGAGHMSKQDHEMFVREHAEGKLNKPEDPGYVIASLALNAPKAMSGSFVSWDSAECAAFRRK